MHRPLPLDADVHPRSPEVGFAVAAKGFRPFFLLAASFAVAILPMWMLALQGVFDPSSYLDAMSWHAHEMIFGYSVAVIAGFLLTAVGNWTKRETLVGAPLLALAAIWILGRIALLGAASLPRWMPAIVDLAFLPALIVVLARSLVAARNFRNFVMLAVLGALFLANAAIHLDALGWLPGWRRRGSLVAIDIVILLVLVIAGRTFPMFTRNATGVASIRSIPILDALTAVGMLLVVVLDATVPDHASVAIASGVVALLAAARTARWGARFSFGAPLLWILHVGYLWIPIGLALRSISALTSAVPASIATHALTVGAIGALTLGMMARVALGHSGRTLVASRPAVAAFALVTAAAIARFVGTVVGADYYRTTVLAAGTLWTAAFALFLVAYARILTSPRVDGKPG